MTDEQKQWIYSTADAAAQAKHVFPNMAACEAALESNYGAAQLARLGNNLFGMKQHTHLLYGTLALPTREYLNSEWVPAEANWVSYPDFMTCFMDRMATLYRLRAYYPHYDAALKASDAMTYVREVSQTWSTDPARAAKVTVIYGEAFPQAVGAMGLEVGG